MCMCFCSGTSGPLLNVHVFLQRYFRSITKCICVSAAVHPVHYEMYMCFCSGTSGPLLNVPVSVAVLITKFRLSFSFSVCLIWLNLDSQGT